MADVNTTPPTTTTRDIFDVLQAFQDREDDRVREAVHQHDMAVVRQINETRGKHFEWVRFMESPTGRWIDSKLTPEQRTLIQTLFDCADDCWSRIVTPFEAAIKAPLEVHARVAEAAAQVNEYAQHLADASRLLRDVEDLLRAGKPTERVGKGYTPTRVEATAVERDARGLITRTVKKSQIIGAIAE
jgi:hypothetical protein